MTYPEALYFTGKCLTLTLYPERIPEIREKIRSGSVEWEQVVWVSTGQFVFAALYLQLKRAALLPELPADLVEYMEEYTDLNRERNQQIIDEALKITSLLNQKGITPVFLKGTAHLLDNLYEDIAERVVGDIDFLVAKEDMVRVAEILINERGFYTAHKVQNFNLRLGKHYPRLQHDDWSAAVEVHRHIVRKPHTKHINSVLLINNSKKLNIKFEANVLSPEHQILHNILNVQLNDKGYFYSSVFLRQQYDLLLLSKRLNPLKTITEFGKFFRLTNANLALTNQILDNPKSIPYKNSWHVKIFMLRFRIFINHPRIERIYSVFFRTSAMIFSILTGYTRLLFRSLYNKEVRDHLYSHIRDPKWFSRHIRQIIETFKHKVL